MKYRDKIKKAAALPFFMGIIILFFSTCTKNKNSLLLFDANGDEINIGNPKAIVLFFLSVDCPLSQSYLTDIANYNTKYTKQGIFFTQVYPGKFLSPQDLKLFISTNKITMPAAFDSENKLCRKFNAKATPQVVVISNNKIVYSGQIDNRATDLQFKKINATVFYLHDVLDGVINREQENFKFTEPVGCIIEQ